MKRMVLIVAMATSFAACNNNAKTESQLREEAFAQIRDSIKLDSFHRAEAEALALSQKQASQAVKNSSRSSSEGTYVKGVSESYTYTEPQKKGWSKAAKGAAIGAGVGAVTGAIVDKKKVRGAVIGGVAGAGTGYVIGRSKDRKDGRIE